MEAEKNGTIFFKDQGEMYIKTLEGELMGEPLCKECAKTLYGFDADEERPSIKKIDPYYQLWYRRQKALPIFEAYLHAELERYKLEQKLEEKSND